MELWVLLVVGFLFISFLLNTEGFKPDCKIAKATPLVCTGLDRDVDGDIGNRYPISPKCKSELKTL